MLLARLASRLVKAGTLTLIDHKGRSQVFRGAQPGPACTLRFHDAAIARHLFFNPLLAFGEAYMDGRLTIEDGDIYDALAFMGESMGWDEPDHWVARLPGRLARFARSLIQYNPAPKARRNVAHHYDLSGRLYDLFLDHDRQYSCAYFVSDDDEIETAQEQKKRHLAAKLLLRDGQRVLDIGCGWGGLALHLAHAAEVEVTGITLSREQLAVARERARAEGLAARVRFELLDYREMEGEFDRIVSVGMFEHVGVPHYREFFGALRELLSEDGVALLHTIGRADGPGATNPWIDKYIFPGGYSPALSEIVPAIERGGFYITDVEVLRLHYALTIEAWRSRFNANRHKVRELYDERFCRMWELYLAASEAAFRYSGHVSFQIQFARSLQAVPLTRDYIDNFERRHPKDRGVAA